MISQTSEYALRAVAWLGAQTEGVYTTGEIAEATDVPANYLAKVLQTLTRKGIVRSRRGPGGGITLARDASELTVLDVVSAVDPLPRIESCPLGIHEHEGGLCSLHHRVDMTMALVEDCLRSATIESLYSSDPRQNPFGAGACSPPWEKKEGDES